MTIDPASAATIPNAADLSQLRDIHLPPEVSWWPPAPGWWLLAGVLLAAVGLGWFLWRRHRRNGWRRAALRELTSLSDASGALAHARLCSLSVLLRRVALHRFPREKVAALHGAAWLHLLQTAPGGGLTLNGDQQRWLAAGPYQAQGGSDAIDDAQLSALLQACAQWIKKLPPQVQP
jgi:hypothetical protein